MSITNKELIAKLKDIKDNYTTTYMWGMFGGPVTESKIQEKTRQYPSFYTSSRQATLRKMIGKNVYAFDCIGLIKGVLWGWNGDPKHPHGGARYQSNNVPDIDANVTINRCKDVSADFSKIVPGSAVWLPGHIGIYIGDGRVIEATPSWKDGVQETACLNIGSIAGLPGRRWTKHGKLPWIEYVVESNTIPTTITFQNRKYPAEIRDGKTVVQAKVLVDMLGANTEIEFRRFAEALGYQVHYNSITKEVIMK